MPYICRLCVPAGDRSSALRSITNGLCLAILSSLLRRKAWPADACNWRIVTSLYLCQRVLSCLAKKASFSSEFDVARGHRGLHPEHLHHRVPRVVFDIGPIDPGNFLEVVFGDLATARSMVRRRGWPRLLLGTSDNVATPGSPSRGMSAASLTAKLTSHAMAFVESLFRSTTASSCCARCGLHGLIASAPDPVGTGELAVLDRGSVVPRVEFRRLRRRSLQ